MAVTDAHLHSSTTDRMPLALRRGSAWSSRPITDDTTVRSSAARAVLRKVDSVCMRFVKLQGSV